MRRGKQVDLSQTLKAGTILNLTQGQYSDYTFDGPFRVLKDFVKQDAYDAFLTAMAIKYPSGSGEDDYEARSINNFVAFLSTSGFVTPVEGAESWYLGGYALFDRD
jgi:hypothetical protein